MFDLAMLEKFVAQHGQFILLDWLIENGHLAYSDYEQWRYGKITLLSDVINLKAKDLSTLITTVNVQCKTFKLSGEPYPYFAWNSQPPKLLRAATDPRVQDAFYKRWLRPQDIPQLDLFMDNSEIITENSLCDALANRQYEQAHGFINALTTINPNNTKLGGYQSLLLYSQHVLANPTIIDADIYNAELNGLELEVLPLAQKLLQRGARDYLAVAWRRLADHVKTFNYDSEKPKLHSSYCYSQIPDWQSVVSVLFKSPSTFDHCFLIINLANAFAQLNDQYKARYCWALAFEQFPQQAQELIEEQQPACVIGDWDNFGELNDGWPDVFFAGFILASQPALIYQAEYFPEFKQLSTQLVAELMAKKLAQDNEIACRQKLQAFSPSLLRMVMGI
ncbi:MAG: hypothetical protein U5M23_01770 [Marinagarivorans sp.]|nr:hypothetical protein [Marinagarivorans sp.]